MSSILHLDSLLQGFIDRVSEKASLNLGSASSIGGKLNKIFGPNGHRQLANTTLREERHARFIAQLRHIITHNGGFVDIEFLENCGFEITNNDINNWKCPKPLWDNAIWPDNDVFLKEYPPYPPPGSLEQKPANLAIDKVVLPYIGHAIDFVQEMKEIFIGLQ